MVGEGSRMPTWACSRWYRCTEVPSAAGAASRAYAAAFGARRERLSLLG
jgi:hypothetical protein